MDVNQLINSIKKSDKAILAAARQKIDLKTKPPGSLGTLEEIAVQLACIRQQLDPVIAGKKVFVFAADHGVTAEGVSAFPGEVTPQMVLNFLNGGAAINVLCRHNGIDIRVVDMGVNYRFENTPGLIDKKIAPGTANFHTGPAMSTEQANASLLAGAAVVRDCLQHGGADIIGLGDMGIGNTTAASAIIAAVCQEPPEKVTGRGTGIDDETLAKKITILRESLQLHTPNATEGLEVLTKVGGFEIGGIAGAALAAAGAGVPVVLDGIISTAGGLIAYLLNPAVADYFFSAHASVEIGQQAALKYMGLRPIFDLNLRLGEGSGAALAINIIEAAAKIMCEMASFEDAGVSNKERGTAGE